MAQGQIYIDSTSQSSPPTVINQANLFPVTPQEIVRCTALAMRRRTALLGPVAKHDPLTAQVLAAASRSISLPNHWSEAWADVERGLAMAAAGKDAQAVAMLTRGLTAGGDFDHPMTCVALLELGRLAMVHGEYPAALKFFEEAGYAAVNNYSGSSYPCDYGVLEEAFRYGTLTHLMIDRKKPYPPLEPAIQWAKTKNLRQLRASLLLCAAENYAALGDTRQAAAMLDEARATIARRKIGAGSIGARFNYLSALTAFQQKRVAEGNTLLHEAMGYMRHGSLWLFHINMVDNLYTDGGVTPRTALDLFAEVLRDPQPSDWNFNPMEAMSVLTTPHLESLEHWFDAAVEGRNVNDVKTALERRRSNAAAPLFHLVGVWRPAAVVAMGSRGAGGLFAAPGVAPTSGDILPPSGLRGAFASIAGDARGVGQAASGCRRSGGVQTTIEATGRIGLRRIEPGGALARDRSAA